MQAAKFYAKVFSNTGATFRRTISESQILALPNIVREVGKPASDVTLTIAEKWDDFGYGEAAGINEFDLVKIYAANESNPTGALVFAGHINEIKSTFQAGRDNVELRIMPIDALLTMSFFRDGASFEKAYSAADVDTMFSDVITHANSVYGSFFSDDLASPGESITVTYDQKKHSEILKAAAEYLDDGWYWRIEADGTIKLAEYSATADHNFTAGFDADKIEVTRSLLNTKNGYRLAWGGTPTYEYYDDSTSAADYGLRETAETDSEIQNSASADLKGDAYIESNKNITTKLMVTVNANYAIETIQPGDTCQVLNVKSGALPSGVRKIVRVEYSGEQAVLHLDEVVDNFGQEFGKAI